MQRFSPASLVSRLGRLATVVSSLGIVVTMACGDRTGLDYALTSSRHVGSGTGTGVGTGIVLFGGFTGDTWSWDGVAWSQHSVPHPPAREGAAMASLGGQAVLFGGYVPVIEMSDFGDTWNWNG